MFVSTYREQHAEDSKDDSTSDVSSAESSSLPPTPTGPYALNDPDSTSVTEVSGAWAALADEAAVLANAHAGELLVGAGTVPHGFKGLATPNMNPMAMALSHEVNYNLYPTYDF